MTCPTCVMLRGYAVLAVLAVVAVWAIWSART